MKESIEPEDSLGGCIGISSRFLPDEHERLMDLACESGFGVFELSVGNFGAHDPRWPRTCDAVARERLRESLRCFSCVILRATTGGLNIASINPGQRDESIRQYLECIEFARDIGAHIVSFCPGTQTWGFVSDPRDIVDRNVAFAAEALGRVEGRGPKLAFLSAGMSLEDMSAIMTAIDRDTFGVDLCVGSLAVEGGVPADANELTDRVLSWVEALRQSLAVVRLSGVHQRWHTDRLAGCPFEMNTCLDFAAIVRKLGRIDYRGPLVLDIAAPDAASVVRHCETAMAELARLYSELEQQRGLRPQSAGGRTYCPKE